MDNTFTDTIKIYSIVLIGIPLFLSILIGVGCFLGLELRHGDFLNALEHLWINYIYGELGDTIMAWRVHLVLFVTLFITLFLSKIET